MSAKFQVSGTNGAALFSLKLHRGDGMTLLAMNWKNGTMIERAAASGSSECFREQAAATASQWTVTVTERMVRPYWLVAYSL